MNDRLIRGDQNTSLPFHSLQGNRGAGATAPERSGTDRSGGGGNNFQQRNQQEQHNLSGKSQDRSGGFGSANKQHVTPFNAAQHHASSFNAG